MGEWINKNKKIILTIFLMLIIIISGTVAWLTWKSKESSLVLTVGEVNGPSISLYPYQLNGTLSPVLNYEGVNYVQVEATNNRSKEVKAKLFYNVKSIDNALISGDVKYTVTSSDSKNGTYTEYATGDLSSASAGETQNVANISIPANSNKFYRVYLWIDGNSSNSANMQNKTLSLELIAEFVSEPSAPELDDGMIPVVIDNSGTETTVKTISEDDSNWYNYDEKKWANVVLTTSSSRSKYLNTTEVSVSESDILAYLVWIPRYKYAIPSPKECSTISNPTVENYPTCYKYILNESDKTSLINWWQSYAAENLGSYTMEQATSDVETGMSTGTITIPGEGDITFVDLVEAYNRINDPDITYTQEFSPSNKLDNSFPREISISFENKNAVKSIGDAIDSNYRTHPAFTFGNTELNGIWVGKFETTGDATTPTVKPNLQSLTDQNVSTQFSTAQKFGTSTYGSTSKIDAHMMKNSEWGAVAYLSHSNYGINEEIYINNSSSFYTGRSGGTTDASPSTNGTYTWDGKTTSGSYASDRTLGTKASTTGNITGVYDMSGGAAEYVMGYYSGASTTWGASSDGNYAGFSSKPDSKYYDDYTSDNLLTACNGGICYGHALSETEHWYSDFLDFVRSIEPWFDRGGSSHYYGANAGAFYSGRENGSAINSFRLVLSAA